MKGPSESRLSAIEGRARAKGAGESQLVGPCPQPRDIVEFILGDEWLARPGFYPRQMTMAKIITLADDLFTDFDRKVIAEWSAGFTRDEESGGSWVGKSGTPPDLLRRMERCRAVGRLWFRHPILVVGRRGGKGHLGAVLMAYVLWWYISREDPHAEFGIAPEKVLVLSVFAANFLQAQDNLAKDLMDVVTSAPCFRPYLAGPRTTRLRLWSHRQVQQGETDPKKAAFEISPREATARAGRGPAAIVVAFDEAAWMQATGANRSAAEIEHAALPALDQCRPFEFVYSASSPWSQTGAFYQNYLRALEVDPATGEPVHFDMVTFQLASWDPYEDWELTGPDGIEVAPGRGPFPRLVRPIQAYDEAMRREQRADPVSFDVERRGQWAAAPDAYLLADQVRSIFAPWGGRILTMQHEATLRTVYFAHIDPSVTANNFAIAIGHRERPDPEGPDHVVFDLLHVWRPQDFPGGRIDYLVIEEELTDLMRRFRLQQLTVDQFGKGSLLDHLQDAAHKMGFSPHTSVFELTETQQSNWSRAEEFKRMVLEGRVHAPAHELAEAELVFLQRDGKKVRAPTMGPVQSDDLADAMMTVATQLEGLERSPHRQLQGLMPAFDHGGLPPDHELSQRLSAAGRRRLIVGTMRQTPRRRRQ